MKHVTQKDIAKSLGISQQTVALVLGRTESPLRNRVKAETARRVQEKARELGYVGNNNARMLRQSRSNLIILLNFYGFSEKIGRQINMIGRRIHEAGYDFRALEVEWWMGDVEFNIEKLMGFRPEGIILNGPPHLPFETRHFEELIRQGIPLVSFGTGVLGESRVNHNAKDPIFEITTNAIRAGRRRLALLMNSDHSAWQNLEKIAGFREAILKAGGAEPQRRSLNYSFPSNSDTLESAILVDPSRAFEEPGLKREMEVAEQILNSPNPADTLVCSNEKYAIGVLNVCNRREISVPDALYVSGFSNTSFRTHGDEFLTSVEQPVEAACEAAVDILLARVNKPADKQPPREERIFACQVIWRKSSPLCDSSNPTFISQPAETTPQIAL
ncbi:MAG: LacI family DNA-binding transcriptional regulator [Chthoniobacterales bacterium]